MFASLAAPAAQVHRPARGDVPRPGPVTAASIGSSSHASVGMGLYTRPEEACVIENTFYKEHLLLITMLLIRHSIRGCIQTSNLPQGQRKRHVL
jgi:hypothetical protein